MEVSNYFINYTLLRQASFNLQKLILFSSQRVLFRLSWLFNFPFASPAHLIILVSKLALDYEKEFFLSLKVINNQSASQNVEGQYKKNTAKKCIFPVQPVTYAN